MAISKKLVKLLADNNVSIVFMDGCALEINIIETIHLDEGDDFIGLVVKISCVDNEHHHPEIGDFINIRLEDIESIVKAG